MYTKTAILKRFSYSRHQTSLRYCPLLHNRPRLLHLLDMAGKIKLRTHTKNVDIQKPFPQLLSNFPELLPSPSESSSPSSESEGGKVSASRYASSFLPALTSGRWANTFGLIVNVLLRNKEYLPIGGVSEGEDLVVTQQAHDFPSNFSHVQRRADNISI